MINKIKAVCSDSLFRSSGLMFAAFMLSSIFNYLFQVVMGRMLGPGQYGFLNALLSLMAVFGIPMAALLMVVSRKAAHFKAKENITGAAVLYRSFTQKAMLWGAACFVLLCLMSPPLAAYLKSPSVIPVILLGLAALMSLPGPINTALLQGLQNYKWLSITMVASGPVKLLICAVPVMLGFGVNGVLIGITVTSMLLWLLGYAPLRSQFSAVKPDDTKAERFSLAGLMPVFIANTAFAVMTQADMVLVNRYFVAHDAGVYASAAILGRAVMYIPGSIVLAMFPMVSATKALNKSSLGLLIKALCVTALFSGFGALLFFFFPVWTMSFFFGAKFIEAAPLLKYFGLAMLPLAFLTVLMNYFVAREKHLFSYLMAAGAALEISLVFMYHSDGFAVLRAISFSGVFVLLAGAAALGFPYFQNKKIPVS